MGLKRHSAKGRGQRVKNFCTMRYALCALLIFIPCARQGLKSQKIPLFKVGCGISRTQGNIVKKTKEMTGEKTYA